MWISTKQTKHKLVSRRSFTAWAAVQSFAVTNHSERRKEDENRKETAHRLTFGALHLVEEFSGTITINALD